MGRATVTKDYSKERFHAGIEAIGYPEFARRDLMRKRKG
jgi:hypothetical protein